VCKKDVNGTLSKEQCSSWCVPITYAKCDTDQGVCYVCNHTTDSECVYPQANCAASCQKKPSLSTSGIWRGNEISKGFQRGEFVFSFDTDSTLTVLFNGMKVTGTVKETSRDITFTITAVSGTTNVKVGDVYNGVFEVKQDWAQTFQFLYIGFAPASGATSPSDLDAAMAGYEFVLASCAKSSSSTTGAQSCDFSSAIQTETIVLDW